MPKWRIRPAWDRANKRWSNNVFSVMLPEKMGVLDFYPSIPAAMQAIGDHERSVGLLRKWRELQSH